MNTKDLRISNLIAEKETGRIGTIKKISQDRVQIKLEQSTLSCSLESVEPIPLTEEWLLKFGFRHITDNWYNVHLNGNTFNVYLFEDSRYRVEIVSQSIGVFEHVHTLQNLLSTLLSGTN